MAVQIFNAGGLGGRRLKVIAVSSEAALPTVVKDGTLAVVTGTAIGTVWAQSETPTGATGDIWIKTGGTSTAPVNMASIGSLIVYPLGAYQYDGTRWNLIIGYARVSGAWVFLLTYLYNTGNTYSELTGGWSAGYSSGTVSFTLEAITMQYYVANTGALYCPTVNKIDLTAYNTIHCRGIATKATNLRLYVGSTRTISSGSAVALQLTALTADTIGEVALDISTLSGQFYVFVGLYSELGPITLSVDCVWMD